MKLGLLTYTVWLYYYIFCYCTGNTPMAINNILPDDAVQNPVVHVSDTVKWNLIQPTKC